MTDMVEKVARAIFREGFAPHEDETVVAAKWGEWEIERERSLRRARAAIAAMREPTDDLLEAASVAFSTAVISPQGRPAYIQRCRCTHQALIDAALNEGGQP